MLPQIDNANKTVTVERVTDLYRQFDRMDVPGYYEGDEQNPYAGRCAVVPKSATVYAMVPAGSDEQISLARALLKGVGGRRKVREKVCTKPEINYNQFAQSGKILVLWV
jgi:hypothetical protein